MGNCRFSCCTEPESFCYYLSIAKSRSMLNRLSKTAHWVLLFSVMAGSFFSSGEGIQPLPFPEIDPHHDLNKDEASSKTLGRPNRSYTLSVHHPTQLSNAGAQKKAKKDPAFGYSGMFALLENAILVLSPRHYMPQNNLDVTEHFVSDPSDRGPPILV